MLPKYLNDTFTQEEIFTLCFLCPPTSDFGIPISFASLDPFCITLIFFNVTFEMHHYFLHRCCLFLSQGLVKVTSLEPISEGPCEYLLIGTDDLDGFLVKTGQIFSKRLVLPLATLKRFVVYNFLCLLAKNWCIIFPPDLGNQLQRVGEGSCANLEQRPSACAPSICTLMSQWLQ